MDRRAFLSALTATGFASLSWHARVLAASSDADVRFLKPGDAEYDSQRLLFNSRIERRPVVIAVCRTEVGVQKAVRRAREEGLAVAIKSGGHHFEGYSSNDGGMCIDLAMMNNLLLLKSHRVVAAPAARLMQVYENLMPLGRLLPTGSCAMVGLSGITLGGGYGLFAREHGLTCDWLTRARLVDGRGNVHEVHNGTELMWALRGGGGIGPGVVTELEFETAPCPPSIWSHRFKVLNLKPEQVAGVAKQWFEISAQLPRDAFAAFVLSGSTLSVLVTSTEQQPGKRLNEALRQFQAMATKSFPAQQKNLPEGVRNYYGKLTPLPFRNASAGFYRGYADVATVITPIAEIVAANPGVIMQINTLGGAIDDPVSPHHSAYAHRGYPYLGEIQSYWDDPARAPKLMQAVDEVQRLFAQAGVRRHYANYADGNLTQWQEAYYGNAWPRLKAIKQQYDPENRFRHPQSGELM